MNRTVRRVLFGVLCLVMAVGLVPATAAARVSSPVLPALEDTSAEAPDPDMAQPGEDGMDPTALQWADTEGRQPMTYEQYRQGLSPQQSFRISYIGGTMFSLQEAGVSPSPLVLVIVNSSIQPGIQHSLNRYVIDLENEGYGVAIYVWSGGTSSDLRAHLQDRLADGLVGCLLIGDLPVPWYEMDEMFITGAEHTEFPIDLYYMDLDGDWVDSDGNGLFDMHSDGAGDTYPDIWVGRLTANTLSGDEVALVNKYFEKNHRYRTGGLSLSHRALVYVDDTWMESAYEWNDDMSLAYADTTLVSDDAATTASDYRNRLDDNYEWIQLCAHSSAWSHSFMIGDVKWAGGSVSSSDIESMNPVALFYNLFACSSGRYVETDYIGGWYVFGGNYGLAAVGSTKSGGMLQFDKFYAPIGQYKSLGESLKEWFVAVGPYDEFQQSWYYGMTLLGDPTLAIHKPPTSVKTTGATAVKKDSATLNGNLTGLGDASSAQVSFEWGLTTSYGNTTTAQTMTNKGPFSAGIDGLALATTYHFRAKAVGDSTVYGSDMTSTTLAPGSPSVETNDPGSINANSARLRGNLTSPGTADSVAVSFVWGTTPGGPYPNETADQVMSSTGAFQADLVSLAGGTTYYYKARAVGDGAGYGDEMSLTTTSRPPAATTNDAASVAANSARLKGTLTSLGTASTVAVSFQWGTRSGSYPNETAVQSMAGTGAFYFDLGSLTTPDGTTGRTTGATAAFSPSLLSLTPGTTYYYRAKVVGDGAAQFGSEKTFTTLVAPAVVTVAASGPTTTSVTLNGSLTSLGTASSVQVCFEWGQTKFRGATTAIQTVNGTGAFTITLTGLASGTTFHFRAQATGDGTAYGEDMTYTTEGIPAAAPEVITKTASGTSMTGAILNADLTGLGSATSVQVSFEWGLTPAYGNATPPETLNATGSFNCVLDGLTPGTTYHFRAKAVGSATVYGGDLTFTTGITPTLSPAVTTGDADGITADSARLNGEVTSLGTAANVAVSFLWGTTPGGPYPNETAGIAQAGGGTFHFDLSGLASGSSFYYQAKAVGDGASYGAEKSFTTTGGAPQIGSLMADNGRQGDDLTVTITGANLTGATGVTFGAGITVSEFRVVSDGEITAKIAIQSNAATGERIITVTTPWGTATVPGGFVVNDAGTQVHLWVYLVSVAGGLVGLGVLATLGLWLRRRLAMPR